MSLEVDIQESDFIHISHEPLNFQNIINLVTNPSSGAIATFIGTTRNNFEGIRLVTPYHFEN